MTRLVYLSLALCILSSCNQQPDAGKFSIAGHVKNLPLQKAYLEQLYFSPQKNPEVIDTADVKNGEFSLTAVTSEEGLFRIRFEKTATVFLLVNDKSNIVLTADNDSLSLQTVHISSPANSTLQNFISETNTQQLALQEKETAVKNYQMPSDTDSAYKALRKQYEDMAEGNAHYLTTFIDTCSSPIVSLFALGYCRDIDPARLEKPVTDLTKRFPSNSAVSSVVMQFNQAIQQLKQGGTAATKIPQPGDMAPELTMPDTEGKMFSLSSLRGQYVLVDFWASWCGPCRAENPNVVRAYNKYKAKNFTVLGVSLDRSKAAWLEAIAADKLEWKQISDLKHWSTAAIPLYGFDGIPYNVLIDPQGKIIATALRGEDLDAKLEEVLK